MRSGRKNDGAGVWLVAMMLLAPLACTAQRCGAGAADVRGTVVDGSGAPVAGASLTAGATVAKSGPDGAFVLPCVANDAVIRVEAASFASSDVKAGEVKTAVAERVVLQPLAAH